MSSERETCWGVLIPWWNESRQVNHESAFELRPITSRPLRQISSRRFDQFRHYRAVTKAG